MSDDRRFTGPGREPVRPDDDKSVSSRARNRTVMLTPEMTGQVRAMLYNEGEDEQRNPLTELLPPLDWARPDGNPNGESAEVSNDLLIGQPTEQSFGDRPVSGRASAAGSTGRQNIDPAMVSAEWSAVSEDRRGTGNLPTFSVNPSASRPGLHRPTLRVGLPVEPPPAMTPMSPMAAPVTPAAPQQMVQPKPTSKVVAFLVSFDKEENGEVIEVRAGRWLITSKATDHGGYVLIDDSSVSQLHAILRATKDGHKLEVLDQLSEYGTAVLRNGQSEEEEVAGSLVSVEHGDQVRFGKRWYVVCMVPKVAERQAAKQES